MIGMEDELRLAGFVPTRLVKALPLLPAPFQTISTCLLDDDLPRPEFVDWFTSRAEAERRPFAGDLIAVGLTDADADRLIAESEYDEGCVEAAYSLLRRALPMPVATTFLGFEVVGLNDLLSFHSWHCYSYAPAVARELGIQVNPIGLLSSYAEARRVLEWMAALPMQQAPVGDEPWTIVALARCG
jgi:hypothetical protein